MQKILQWFNDFYENIPNHLLRNGSGNSQLLKQTLDTDGNSIEFYNFDKIDRQIVIVNGEVKGFLSQNDYVFKVKQVNDVAGNSFTALIICDYQVFLQNNHLSEWEKEGLVYLPLYLYGEELCSGQFTSKYSVFQTEQDLLALGFIQDTAFNQYT